MVPSDISGLQFWVKADQIEGLADGDPISTWADQSGNGRDLTAALGLRPTYKTGIVNGLPVARCTTATDMRASAIITGTTARSIFLILKSGITANSGMFSLSVATSGDGSAFTITPEIAVRVINGFRSFTVSTGTAAFRVLTVTSAAISDVNALSAYLDGTALTESGVSAKAINTGATGASMSFHPSIGEAWAGDMAEIIAYDTVLSAGDRAGIHSYVQDKYAITVSDYVAGTTPLTFTGTSDLNA